MKRSDVGRLRTGSIIQARFRVNKSFTICDYNNNIVRPVVRFNENDLAVILEINRNTESVGVKFLNITQNTVFEDCFGLSRLEHCFSLVEL